MDRIARVLFVGSIIMAIFAGAFAFGVLVGRYQIWPAEQIRLLAKSAESLARYQALVPDGRRMRAPTDAIAQRHVIIDESRAMTGGHFALFGWDNAAQMNAVWLYSADGEMVHKWPVDDARLSAGPATNSSGPHGLLVLKDGSVMVNFDRIGEVFRLDACGEPVWTATKHYHHSLAPSADGSVWTWAGRGHSDDEHQARVRLDADTGQELERIDLIGDVLAKTDMQAVALSVLPGHRFSTKVKDAPDRFHPNDVEELLPEMAASFPMFAVGDLLLSVRNLNLVMVMGRDGTIKWGQYGPWHQQHDPDFNADGTITVFDNNRGRATSRLLRVRPGQSATQTMQVLTPAFQSAFRGKHQILPNGSALLVVPTDGQALEIAPDGRVVRQFNNPSDFREGFHEDLVNAQWLPEGFFDQMPNCQNP